MTTEFGYPRRQYSGCRQIDLVLKEGHSDQSPCLACHEIRWQRECAGRNASERRASLEKDNAQADPMGFSGKADTAGVNERSSTPSRCAGVVATACTQGKRTQHGKPQGVVRQDQPDAREGQIGRLGVAERFAVPLRPGNSGGGKGPQFKADAGYRFDALYDKISREDILAHAYAQCRSNKGAPGVDGQDFADIEAYGVERWLAELALVLRGETYRPEPIRRVFIPKANGKTQA